MYGPPYILYVAANTCMVRAVLYCTVLYCTVLYCTVLRAFSHFHAIYRSFPYNSARNSYFPLHLQYAQVQFGILAVKSTNQPELGSNLGHV